MTCRQWGRFGFAALVCAIVVPAGAQAQAQIEIVETWVSASHAKAGDGIIVKATVKNTGTTVLHNVWMRLNGSDEFDFFQPRCDNGAPTDDWACLGELAPGEEMFATFAAEVCCFFEGFPRGAFLKVYVSTAEGARAETSYLPVRMVGSGENQGED